MYALLTKRFNSKEYDENLLSVIEAFDHEYEEARDENAGDPTIDFRVGIASNNKGEELGISIDNFNPDTELETLIHIAEVIGMNWDVLED